jgi:hypothetical protein
MWEFHAEVGADNTLSPSDISRIMIARNSGDGEKVNEN